MFAGRTITVRKYSYWDPNYEMCTRCDLVGRLSYVEDVARKEVEERKELC